jgi:hypothetical protein
MTAMIDFPRSWLEFRHALAMKPPALNILAHLTARWPDRLVRPGCSGCKVWRLGSEV